METKKPWGSSRVLFFALKNEIEADLLKAIPKKEIWQKHFSVLNCSYANFVQLCNKYIGEKLVRFTAHPSKETDLEKKVPSEPAEQLSKPKSVRPVFKARKITFTPSPDPEDVKRWLRKTTKK